MLCPFTHKPLTHLSRPSSPPRPIKVRWKCSSGSGYSLSFYYNQIIKCKISFTFTLLMAIFVSFYSLVVLCISLSISHCILTLSVCFFSLFVFVCLFLHVSIEKIYQCFKCAWVDLLICTDKRDWYPLCVISSYTTCVCHFSPNSRLQRTIYMPIHVSQKCIYPPR